MFLKNINKYRDHHSKKIAEGKTYTEATLSGARKLTYRIYAVWKRRMPYTAIDE